MANDKQGNPNETQGAGAAAASQDAVGEKAKKAKKLLRVVSRKEGFWRAGIQFGTAPKDLDPAAITKGQIEAIKAEPMLIVTEVEE